MSLAIAGCAHAPAQARPLPTLGAALSALPDAPVNAAPFRKTACFGKVVMVFFLSTWCFPCLADLPVMQKLQEDLGKKGYVTIAVGLDLDGRKTLAPFAETYALPYPLLPATAALLDGDTVFGHVRELPTRFVFARDGTLALAFSGVAEPSELMAAVQKVVEKP